MDDPHQSILPCKHKFKFLIFSKHLMSSFNIVCLIYHYKLNMNNRMASIDFFHLYNTFIYIYSMNFDIKI